MKIFTDILTGILVIALIVWLAPSLFEILAFVFVLFLQLALGLIVAGFIVQVVSNLFDSGEEGQRAYSY